MFFIAQWEYYAEVRNSLVYPRFHNTNVGWNLGSTRKFPSSDHIMAVFICLSVCLSVWRHIFRCNISNSYENLGMWMRALHSGTWPLNEHLQEMWPWPSRPRSELWPSDTSDVEIHDGHQPISRVLFPATVVMYYYSKFEVDRPNTSNNIWKSAMMTFQWPQNARWLPDKQ